MRDKGLVINTKEDLAQVEVFCFIESCHKCSARSLCIGQDQSKGILSVKNPLKATPGDEVNIEIPDSKYNKALILLFSSLLLASLLGMGAGYFLSPLLLLSSSAGSLLGLLFALTAAVIILFRYFQKNNKNFLYPVIISIIKKGDHHG